MFEQSVSSVSAAKRAANQCNARKSTGPRTPRGKAVAARNALRHGLFAKSLLLSGEDPAELSTLRVGLLRRLNPRDPMEAVLVDRIVAAVWKLRRVERFESVLFARACDDWNQRCENEREQFGLGRREPVPVELAWQAASPELRAQFDRLSVQMHQLESAMHRNLRQLALLQKLPAEAPITEFADQAIVAEQSALQNWQNEATAAEQLTRRLSIAKLQQVRAQRNAKRQEAAERKSQNEAKRLARKAPSEPPRPGLPARPLLSSLALLEALELQKLKNEATARGNEQPATHNLPPFSISAHRRESDALPKAAATPPTERAA